MRYAGQSNSMALISVQVCWDCGGWSPFQSPNMPATPVMDCMQIGFCIIQNDRKTTHLYLLLSIGNNDEILRSSDDRIS